jgi:putative protease
MNASTLELLAPARNADIGIEAVQHGADAVYIGGPEFGARYGAGNSVSDIERLVRHAHRFDARIFVTVNTILRDDELDAAQRLSWQLYEAGVDALIVQDMGMLELDLPPIQLHASTQTDIRTPEKARFLQDVGFSQIVLARELDLATVRAIASSTQQATLEFFVHGALCVAYSGQCYVSHAQTGRSANRGDCSQACRLPYTVTDQLGRVVAHEKHVLSMKDNNQSDNLEALIDAGIRSFKIEGRYKDAGYVKNITAHYRQRLDAILTRRTELRASSAGKCEFNFTPDPDRNFNRGATDYFVNGRQDDIGAFDSPKHAGLPLGHVVALARTYVDIELEPDLDAVANGDGLTFFNLQGELVGLQVNVAKPLGGKKWRIEPNEPVISYTDLRVHTALSRNRDMTWDRMLERKSADRRIAVDLRFFTTDDGFALLASDAEGCVGSANIVHPHEIAQNAQRAETSLREQLGKLGNTIFSLGTLQIDSDQPWFIPASAINSLRRGAIEQLQAARERNFVRLQRIAPVEPPVPYPDGALSYLANVFNHRASEFYARHGVKVIDAAYESHEETGEVSLMITKHCVRFSLSLCPKQAKGVTGVQGTVKAESLTIVHGNERLTLRFDCKPCEMHVVGRMKKSVIQQTAPVPMTFYRTRPRQPEPQSQG